MDVSSVILNQPLHHPQTDSYVSRIKDLQYRFILFVLRSIEGHIDGLDSLEIGYTDEHRHAVSALLTAWNQKEDTVLPLHNLCMALVSTFDRVIYKSRFQCPYLLFLIVVHLHDDGSFSRVDLIPPTIATLVFAMRLICVYDAHLNGADSPME